MPVPKEKRKCRDMSDSDDEDSDDDLLISVFGISSSKRKNSRDEEKKKKKRMAQMNALLDNGKVKLERENRMDDLCRQNNELMKNEGLRSKNNDRSNDEGKSCTDAASSLSRKKSVEGYGSSSLHRRQQNQKNIFQISRPKDVKETSCLGSRSTLQFSRVISIQTTFKTLSPCSHDKERRFTPFWFGLQEALTDLRSILLADQQQQQGVSSFTPLRKELLQLCTTKPPHVCRTYLRKRLMCKQGDQERIRRIPVNVLRWLMVMACGPLINGCVNGGGSNNQNRNAKAHEKQNMKQSARRSQNLSEKDNCCSKTTDLLMPHRLLTEAQTGAHQTLCRLWSQDLGFPLQQQQQQNEIYLLSISALPRQLCQWFGSSLCLQNASGDNEKKIRKMEERDGNILVSSILSLPLSSVQHNTDSIDDSNKERLRVTSTRTALVHFLQLWSLALQKQNKSESIKNNIHLVHFNYDKENRLRFRNDISDAIMAVLWAGLNPSFASSRSAKIDGNRYIQTIVACLLDRVRREATYYSYGNDDVDNGELFGEWVQTLSERVCAIWSKELGRGQKGTDAYEDEHAWLCLARSVTRLTHVDGCDYEKLDGSYGKRIMVSPLKELQLSLCRCILKRAFGDDQDGRQLQDTKKGLDEKKYNKDGKSDDWVSRSVVAEMRRVKVPSKIRSTHRWQAMTVAVVGLAKLASSFPEEEASKCFALMDICTLCFQSAIVELEHEIQLKCLEEGDGFDDNDDVQITNDNATTTASRSGEDEILERHALYNALVRLEIVSEIISNKTRIFIMRNICFPWASHMAESLRNYARSQKEHYAPPSVMNMITPAKQQSMINTFFKSDRPSGKLITH